MKTLEQARKFYDKEPHLPHLDRSKIIIAAEYLLSGKNPPTEESDYFSKWVHARMFEHCGPEQRHFDDLAVCENDRETPEGQRQLLELAIREVLEGVRTLPSFRNLHLTNGLLQTYRRELTWLLGRWIELANDEPKRLS